MSTVTYTDQSYQGYEGFEVQQALENVLRYGTLSPAGVEDGTEVSLLWNGLEVRIFGSGLTIDSDRALSAGSIGAFSLMIGDNNAILITDYTSPPAFTDFNDLLTAFGSYEEESMSATFDTVFGPEAAAITGSDGADYIVGTVFDDTIDAGDGNDEVHGDDGADSILGGVGQDKLFGEDGNDTLVGGYGFDVLVGGSGADTFNGLTDGSDPDDADQIQYGNEDGELGVTVDLGAGTATDTFGSVDTLIDIEEVVGTHLDDSLFGSAESNNLIGLAGNDTLHGGSGDTATDGSDQVNYRNEDFWGGVRGVSVDLVAGTAIDAFGDTDTLVNIERVVGTNRVDIITGDANNNRMRGLRGSDTMDGGAGTGDELDYRRDTSQGGTQGVTVDLSTNFATDGFGDRDYIVNFERVTGTTFNDLITGSAGNNRLQGYSGADTLVGLGGDDSLVGGSETDLFKGGAGNDTLDGAAGNTTIDSTAESDDYDTAWYFDEGGTRGITMTMAAAGGTWTVIDTFGNTDTLIDIEEFGGTNAVDVVTGNEDSNNFVGFGGNDTFDGAGGNDQINYRMEERNGAGTLGVSVNLATGFALDTYGATDKLINIERVQGTNKADIIIGDANGNRIRGLGGNDTLDGGAGGGDQIDYIRDVDQGGSLGVVVNLGTGTATDGFGAIDTISNFERVNGTNFNDTIIGNGANNTLWGNAGEDLLRGNDGNDLLVGGYAFDNFVGGAGNDTLDGGTDSGDPDDSDTISYFLEDGTGAVSVDLAAGTAIDTQGDTDTLNDIEFARGAEGNDTLLGSSEGNQLTGMAGDDLLDGRGGTDEANYLIETNNSSGNTADLGTHGVTVDLSLGTATDSFGGTDTLINIEQVRGTSYADLITGDAYNNRFRTMAGDDTVDGGAGTDLLDYRREPDNGATHGVVVSLADGTATDGYGDTDTIANIENVQGTVFSDEIAGDDGANDIRGNEGQDELEGGSGNDTLVGGTEYDVLVGGAGDDVLDGYGGSGADTDSNQANYADAGEGITISLTAAYEGGASVEGGASIGTDVLLNISEIRGSEHDDYFFASGDFYVAGQGNWNQFEGGAGNDTVEGNGNTRVAFFGAEEGVYVNLDAGIAHDLDDSIDSSIGVDEISGVNAVAGSSFDDMLIGSDNWEQFRGQDGNDTIDGAGGTDKIRYNNAKDGVSVNLVTHTASGRTAGDVAQVGTDTIYNIENIQGSNHADILIGDEFNNMFEGLGGNDSMVGGAYNDVFIGGAGNDTMDGTAAVSDPDDYDSAYYHNEGGGGAVTLNLATGVATDTFGNTDRLIDIEEVSGASGNDSMLGNAEGNSFSGFAGNDTIDGGTGGSDGGDQVNYRLEENNGGTQGVYVNLAVGTAQDTFGDSDTLRNIERVIGTNQADLVIGSSANNRMRGLGGADTMDGGAGTDELDYRRDTNNGGSGAITVDLAAGTATDGFGETDTISNFENVNATEQDDVLIGNASANVLWGNGGADTLAGGAGNDTLDGGGNGDFGDAADYSAATAGVSVNLATGTASDGFGGTDTLVNVEDVLGSENADTIIGGAGGNRLDGAGGADSLSGGEGDDTLVGGAGADTFVAGAGSDTVEDFDIGEDVVNLKPFGTFIDYAAVLAAAAQIGSDVVIDLGPAIRSRSRTSISARSPRPISRSAPASRSSAPPAPT